MSYTFEEFRRDLAREVMSELPPEDRLRGLPAEERVKGVSPEDLVNSLEEDDLARLKALLEGRQFPGASKKEDPH